MIIPVAGTFVRHVAGGELVANPAVALLVDAGEVSRTSHPWGGHDRSLYMSLSPDLAAWFPCGSGGVRRRLPVEPSVSLTIRLAASRAGRGEELSSLYLEEMVAALAATRPDPSPSRFAGPAVRRAEEYLAVNFRQDAGLRTVAAEVGYSPHHLSRMFRRVVGVPLGVYRNRLRVAEALRRLLEGDTDIARVAVESGFYDHAHLARQVRRETGQTPRQIRAFGLAEGPNQPRTAQRANKSG